MIDIISLQEKLISTLNNAYPDTLYIKNFNLNNKPTYPYATVQVLNAYIPENEQNRPSLTKNFNADTEKIVYTRKEQPQFIFSINVYSNTRTQAVNTALKTVEALKFKIYNELANNNIVVLEVTNITNATEILEVDFEFRYTFDVRCRSESNITKEVDYVADIELTQTI